MRAAVICFTENGMRTALRAGSALGEFDPVIWIRKKDLRNTRGGAVVWEGSLGEWTKQRFKDSGLIISRREGQEMYYRAADTDLAQKLHHTIEEVAQISCPS